MLPYFYQYTVGGALFAAGMLVAWRQGDVGLAPGAPRRNLLLLAGGFAAYAGVHALFQFVLPAS